MSNFLIFLKKFVALIQQEKLPRVLIILAVVVLSGSLFFLCFEKGLTFSDALWWSFVTVTTVGYGDISPITPGGRIVGIVMMLTGIGFLGILTAGIASIFIEEKIMENKGMKSVDAKDHFILCGWNFRGHQVLEELRADPKCRDIPLVVIADISEKPLDDPQLCFIRGEVDTDALKKACLDHAKVVIVLSDDTLDAYARDAKSILNVLTVKSLNPEVYTCVELMDHANLDHCQMAKADEIIVVGEINTNLLVQAALDHGITRVISELVSNRYGEELYRIKLPPDMAGQNFFQVLCELKERYNMICIGIEDQAGKHLITNPSNDYKPGKEDWLIVISTERPEILTT